MFGRLVGVALVLSSAIVGVPLAAFATGGHSLAVIPATGTLDDTVSVSSAGPCTGGTFFHILVTGAGLESHGSIITGATEVAGLPRTSDHSLYAPLSSTLRSFFADHHVNAPRGRYTVTLRCRAKLDFTSLDDFTATIAIDGSGRYTALGDAARAVAKPDDGGVLGGTGSVGFTPPADQLTGAQPVAAAQPAHRSSYTWQLLVVLVALVGGLEAVRRRISRSGTRPGASTNLRKVGQ